MNTIKEFKLRHYPFLTEQSVVTKGQQLRELRISIGLSVQWCADHIGGCQKFAWDTFERDGQRGYSLNAASRAEQAACLRRLQALADFLARLK